MRDRVNSGCPPKRMHWMMHGPVSRDFSVSFLSFLLWKEREKEALEGNRERSGGNGTSLSRDEGLLPPSSLCPLPFFIVV